MLPASLYAPIYYHTMLLVVVGCALFYWVRQGQPRGLNQFNLVAMLVAGCGVLLFMGLRPVSGVFIDMVSYAWDYERLQQGLDPGFNDRLFNGLMRLCAPVLPVGGFFFVCALIYIAPLAAASWRVHGAWAFPVFLACLTSLSFWAYGVNGIRNGMATSVLILAFAFQDKPLVMFPLMASAWGFHGSVLLPAGAFLVVRYIKRTEIWLAFWLACVALTFVAGNVGEMLLSRYNPFAWDNRVDAYILGSEGAGFRADFLLYSIVPVLVTLLLAAPSRARIRQLAGGVVSAPAMKGMWNRNAWRLGTMGMAAQVQQCGAGVAGGLACASLAQIDGGPSARPRQPRKKSGNGSADGRRERLPQNSWERLPWVRLLRSDPFYARLVNTYLLANGIWVLLIHANFSNRFAYLSWFMMPWVLVYPFVPGKVIHRPRIALIAATVLAQYLFSYVMAVVVYPLRGGGFL